MNQTKSMLSERILGRVPRLILLVAILLPRTSYSGDAGAPITVPAAINLTNCARALVDDYMDFLALTPTHSKDVSLSVLSYSSDPAKDVTNIRMGLLWDFRKGVSLAATGSMTIRKKSLTWIHDSANHKTEEFVERANRKPNFEYWIAADAEK